MTFSVSVACIRGLNRWSQPDQTLMQPSSASLCPNRTLLECSSASLRPNHTLLEPSSASLSPNHTLLEPSSASLSPKHTLLEPSSASLSPNHTLLEPSSASLCPNHTLLEPSSASLSPNHTFLEPSSASLSPKHTLLEPSSASLRPNHILLEPSSASLCPSHTCWSEEGMGHLRITKTGLELNGDSEFLRPLYAKEIQSRPGSPLFLQSSKNVSINILDGKNRAVTQLVAGSSGIHACCKLLEVKSNTGKLLFSADAHEVVVGAEKLRVPGAEGAVFSNSVETPHVRSEPFKELRLESPTRSLYMEAPKGVQIMAEAGDIRATCRSEMRLESKDGEPPQSKQG
ncbi:uncharacterized protein LOC125750481 isoform X2 [Brienomyrus brachyistius]|uniref:uncharacterized protein LOC125750481 isoform X2 n=1 Tax=Brienomyrus brachyistius TaxID=42636 RepID=UPI0020B2949E|nr:uncharacterized protein LOC125750481 isoform X2 [Brienomyrus brachyistius]